MRNRPWNVGAKDFAEELYRENSRIYVVGTSAEAENSVHWQGLGGIGDCDFQLIQAFDAKEVLKGYARKKGGTTRRFVTV